MDIQALIDDTDAQKEIVLPSGQFYLPQPLNLRNKWNVRIRSEGRTVLSPGYDPTGPLYDRTPMIDMSGSAHCRFGEGIILRANEKKYPWAALLLARNETGNSAGCHVFSNLTIEGTYRLADVVCYCSEVNQWRSCFISNTAVDASKGGFNMLFVDENRAALTPSDEPIDILMKSMFGPIGECKNNNMVHSFDGCIFTINGTPSANHRSSIVIYQGCSEMTFQGGCYFSAGQTSRQGRYGPHSIFRIDRLPGRSDGNCLSNFRVINARSETAAARYWLYIGNGCSPFVATNFHLSDNSVECRESVIYCSDGVYADSWDVKQINICRADYDWSVIKNGWLRVRPTMRFDCLEHSNISCAGRLNQIVYHPAKANIVGKYDKESTSVAVNSLDALVNYSYAMGDSLCCSVLGKAIPILGKDDFSLLVDTATMKEYDRVYVTGFIDGSFQGKYYANKLMSIQRGRDSVANTLCMATQNKTIVGKWSDDLWVDDNNLDCLKNNIT